MINAQSIVDQLGKGQLVSRATVLDLAMELARLQQPAAVPTQYGLAAYAQANADFRPAPVPAAGVQGDAEAELLNMLGRIHPMAMKREDDIGGGKERLTRAFTRQQPWPVPDQACIVWRADLMRMSNDLTHKQAFFDHTLEQERKATVQQDSGRDAALWTCRKMNDLGSIYDSKGELVANTYYQCANGITEAHNAAIRALATHPAPSSDAHGFLPMKRRGSTIYLGRAGGFDVRYCPEPEALAEFIVSACNATHPANGAQAGLSESEIEAIRHAGELLSLEGYTKQADDMRAILAAAKKGGA